MVGLSTAVNGDISAARTAVCECLRHILCHRSRLAGVRERRWATHFSAVAGRPPPPPLVTKCCQGPVMPCVLAVTQPAIVLTRPADNDVVNTGGAQQPADRAAPRAGAVPRGDPCNDRRRRRDRLRCPLCRHPLPSRCLLMSASLARWPHAAFVQRSHVYRFIA